jgi:hypothetical protein
MIETQEVSCTSYSKQYEPSCAAKNCQIENIIKNPVGIVLIVIIVGVNDEGVKKRIRKFKYDGLTIIN